MCGPRTLAGRHAQSCQRLDFYAWALGPILCFHLNLNNLGVLMLGPHPPCQEEAHMAVEACVLWPPRQEPADKRTRQ